MMAHIHSIIMDEGSVSRQIEENRMRYECQGRTLCTQSLNIHIINIKASTERNLSNTE